MVGTSGAGHLYGRSLVAEMRAALVAPYGVSVTELAVLLPGQCGPGAGL